MLAYMTLWTRGDDAKPGPRPAYTLDQLADACIVIADAEGLGALSMRRVAQQLGTAAASLYRYVDGKNDLIALMVDRVLAAYHYDPASGDVRKDVLAILEQSRTMYRIHPWLAQATSADLGPNSVRYLDKMAGALAPAQLDPASTMMGVAMLSGWLTTFAAHENAALASGSVRHQQIATMIESGEYPHLAALFDSSGADSATEPLDIDAVFRAGVEAMLFGIAPNV